MLCFIVNKNMNVFVISLLKTWILCFILNKNKNVMFYRKFKYLLLHTYIINYLQIQIKIWMLCFIVNKNIFVVFCRQNGGQGWWTERDLQRLLHESPPHESPGQKWYGNHSRNFYLYLRFKNNPLPRFTVL